MDMLDALVLEDGRRWGDVATERQREDAAAILDGKVQLYHWLGRSRGYSKTTDLAGIALVLLLTQASGRSRSYAVAADLDQAGLLLDAIAGFVHRDPALARLVEVGATKITVRKTGATLEALPADQSSAWGLKPVFVVVDELVEWGTTRGPRRIFDAVMTAVPKTGGRLVVASTAGDPAHWSAKLREHALADELWRVSETDGPAPWIEQRLLDEQRRRLPESLYARLYLNRWTSGEDRLVTEEDLDACMVLDGPQPPISGMAYQHAVDLGTRNDRTVVVTGHIEHSVVVVDRVRVWQGTRLRPVPLAEVEAYLFDASQKYRGPIIIDHTQAELLVQNLKRRRVDISTIQQSRDINTSIASTLLVQLRERMLRLPKDPEMRDELLNVRLISGTDGKLRIDHDSGRHDDRAVALALLVHRLVARGARDAPMLVSWSNPTKVRLNSGRDREMSDALEAGLRSHYGSVMGGRSSLVRRIERRLNFTHRGDRILRERFDIPVWNADRGRAELQEILDDAGRRAGQ